MLIPCYSQLVVSDPASLAQSITNTTQQILQTSATATHTLNSFKEIEKLFLETKQHYDRLQQVNTLLKNSSKVKQSVELLWQISEQYIKGYSSLLQQQSYSAVELKSIENGYLILLEKANDSWGELSLFLTPTTLIMDDKQRFDSIERIFEQINHYYLLMKYFDNKTRFVANKRTSTSVASFLCSSDFYQRNRP